MRTAAELREEKLALRRARREASHAYFDRLNAQQTSAREELIRTPLRRRFRNAEAAAETERSLSRKASSEAQRLVVADIIARSFASGECAGWVRPDLESLVWRAGLTLQDVEMALWLAAVAGLVERRRFGAEWRYTAVPEIWQYLPDYPPREPERSEGVA